MVEDHYIVWFKLETNYEGILNGGSWFIPNQLLIVAPWVADFVLDANMVQRTVIWIL